MRAMLEISLNIADFRSFANPQKRNSLERSNRSANGAFLDMPFPATGGTGAPDESGGAHFSQMVFDCAGSTAQLVGQISNGGGRIMR